MKASREADELSATKWRVSTETQAAPTFSVDTREGTVTGPGGAVRLEPKVMEVLKILTNQAGRVVTRDELLEAVWPGVVVTEHTLSRCIYQLRQELAKIDGDTERTLIETLPKRGYRLLADVATATTPTSRSPGVERPRLQAIPFVVGQWVCGERFYGRGELISEILDGHRNCIWLLGTRRIGKTSLLKQVEYLAETPRESRYMPVFWDFQGAATPGELHLNFTDALLDAEERLARVGIELDDVQADDLFVSLERLRRRLSGKSMKLLLLCDEVEELIELQREDPALLRKLRRAMQSREDVRTVLASTIRLWALAEQREDTSPFLHGFAPPLYIERLVDDEARSLIRQSNLAPGDRPGFDDEVIESIRVHCDNHPYLVQLVCKRYLEAGDLEDAFGQVATDRMVSYFFSVDFDMLSDEERTVVRTVSQRLPVSADALREEIELGPDEIEGVLHRLQNLGFIRRSPDREFTLANFFFRRWLQQSDDEPARSAPAQAHAAEVVEDAVDTHDIERPDPRGFFAELKRRNVIRVGVAYAVVAWALLQLGEILFGFLEVPVWAGKLLIAFIVLGFPIALVLAWALEVTPQGVKWERDVDRSQFAPQRSGRRFEIIIIAILAIAVLMFAIERFA